MALLLLAGLLSVQGLEHAQGTASVPGTVVLEAGSLGAGTLEALVGRWPGTTVEWVAADAKPLSPFAEGLARAEARGDRLLLFSADAVARDGAGAVPPWHAVLDGFPDLPARPRSAWMIEAASRFIAASTGARGFLLALLLAGPDLEQPEALLDSLVDAARTLPSYRRTTIVLLGAWEGTSSPGRPSRRPCLRIPVGDWSHHWRPELADLLAP